MLIPTAEPFLFPGRHRTGVLLVHGFTGTPKEMRPLGEYLNAQGYPVLGVRLFAHATQLEDMRRARWEDWLASVTDGWHLLRGLSDRIVVCGLSMGGVLSLLFGARFPVAGIVAMSTPYRLPDDPRLKLLPILQHLIPYLEKGPPDHRDPSAFTEHISYPKNPTHGILELRELLAEMRAALPHITVPTLVIHSRNDGYVPWPNGQAIYEALGTPQKRLLWVENSGHVVTREPDHPKVFAAIGTFLAEVSAA